LLLLVVSAFMTLGLSLFARVPIKRDWTPFAFICSVGGTFYFLAVRLSPGVQVIPEVAGAALQLLGIGWQLFAKVSLRRSFGILPANRGVVSHGAYRIVRHPMYLGYFMTDIGFLLANFGIQNMIVYGCQFALQVGRIVREERLLSHDAQYRAYRCKVRRRVIPGVF
jgi:protein-S-isoprenylcysteine O-methyltransferase Ste14